MSKRHNRQPTPAGIAECKYRECDATRLCADVLGCCHTACIVFKLRASCLNCVHRV
jgi:hypothetical protein